MARADEFAAQLRANLTAGPHHVSDIDTPLPPIEPAVRLIAYYLPQFHPIPENDLWWGKGFTEWTNVSKALPQFAGHYQPRLPGQLGFYDLRSVGALRAQAALARKYGVFGFCFYYYWFNGKRLLETPLNLLLQEPDIDLPFCVCWSNENWTRRWDGLDNEILIAQEHSNADDIAFARSLEPALRDRRYIRVKGRPVILLYRPGLLPDALATARRWRVHFAREGFGDPYLVMVQSFDDVDPRIYGFDAAAEFPPHRVAFGLPSINSELRLFDRHYRGNVVDYGAMVRQASTLPPSPFRLFRGVCPGWDNEARRPGRGFVVAHSTPQLYGQWLAAACNEAMQADDPSERIVFINAWNEWSEGAYLEPDRHFGCAYLKATSDVIGALAAPKERPRLAVVSHDAYFHGAQMLALHIVRSLVADLAVEPRVLLGGPGELEAAFGAVAPSERIEGGFGDLAAWELAGQRLRADGCTAVLCNSLVSAQAIAPLRRAGLRVVLLVHELPVLIRAYGLVETARIAAREADCIVFGSAYTRDRFVELAGEIAGRSIIRPQGVFLPPAADDEREAQRAQARAELGAGPADLVVLSVGYGDHRKGIDLWPGLARRVLAECTDALFVWVGRIEESIAPKVHQELEDFGIAGQVRFLGNVEPLQPMYAAADVFLLTSREDPFPNVALEAMAHGLPVVAFEGSGGIVELVRETGATLSPLADVDAMACTVIGLLGDPDARVAIGAAGAERIARDFCFRDYVATLLALSRGDIRTVSVVVPNYNYAGFLRQRIESVWSQTYPIYEVILLDDASTDDSARVIAELARQARGRFRVVRNDVNSGSVTRQWARGVALATGELVWIAEADDFADRGFLAATVPAFDHADVTLSYAQSRQIDDDGQVMAQDYLDYVADIDTMLWRADYRRLGVVEIAEALSVKNTIPNVSAVVFRRDALQRVLRDHIEELVSYRNAADWCCYLRLLTSGSVAFTAVAYNNHRRHTRGVTLSGVDQRQLREIGTLQRLARDLAPVRVDRIATAAEWYAEVARKVEVGGQAAALPMAAAGQSGNVRTGPLVRREDWLDVVCAAYHGRCSDLPAAFLPGFPSEALQIKTTGHAGRATLQEAYNFYRDCVETFERAGRPLRRGNRLLDFGVGWGRIGRFFLNEIEPDDLYGIDVNTRSIDVCRELFAKGHFDTCRPWPPTDLPSRQFSFIVGFSVFSHLSEVACHAWMLEFHRLLAPGGIVALTTRGRWFFDFCISLRDRIHEGGYIAALAQLFADVDDAKQRYDAGQLVFATSAGVSGGGVLDASYYGETFIPKEFAGQAYLPHMELIEFQSNEARPEGHPILFFQRRA